MRGQPSNLLASSAAIRELIGEVLGSVAEQLEIARQRDVAGIPAAVDDARARKQLCDKPDAQDVIRQLVHDAGGTLSEVMPQDMGVRRFQPSSHLARLVAAFASEADGDARNVIELTGAKDARMTGADLLDHRRAGTGHADDEDRQLR